MTFEELLRVADKLGLREFCMDLHRQGKPMSEIKVAMLDEAARRRRGGLPISDEGLVESICHPRLLDL